MSGIEPVGRYMSPPTWVDYIPIPDAHSPDGVIQTPVKRVPSGWSQVDVIATALPPPVELSVSCPPPRRAFEQPAPAESRELERLIHRARTNVSPVEQWFPALLKA